MGRPRSEFTAASVLAAVNLPAPLTGLTLVDGNTESMGIDSSAKLDACNTYVTGDTLAAGNTCETQATCALVHGDTLDAGVLGELLAAGKPVWLQEGTEPALDS